MVGVFLFAQSEISRVVHGARPLAVRTDDCVQHLVEHHEAEDEVRHFLVVEGRVDADEPVAGAP